MYRYYLTQRPASPGTFPVPDDNPAAEVHNYDRRTFIPELQCMVYGYVEYRQPLELYNRAIFELMEAPEGDGLMQDQNGRTIRTGDVVRVTGAQPPTENGLFFVERGPRDPNWGLEIYCLMRLCENGRLSTSSRNISYWPYPNGQAETAKIEVLPDFQPMTSVIRYFENQMKRIGDKVKRGKAAEGEAYEGGWTDGYCTAVQAHCKAVIERIRSRMEGQK